MNGLLTNNPIALRALMSETIFTSGVLTEPPQELAMPVAEESTTIREEFIYRGDKSSGVLFILRYADHPYFSPEAEDAFVKTIGALQLTPENVAVVNLANPHNPNDFARIMEFFQPKKITLLGVDPVSLKLPAIAHNSYKRGRVATVFNTFSFEEMFVDVHKKRQFWTEFKSFLST